MGLRQALKMSIYDYFSKFNQINAELFLNSYDAIIFIPVNQYKFYFGPCAQYSDSLDENVIGQAQ